MRTFCLIAGLLLLFATETLSLYFLMPFIGGQEANAVNVSYFFHNNIVWLRIAGLSLIAWPAYHIFRYGKNRRRILLLFAFAGYGAAYYYFNIYIVPVNIFEPMKVKTFAAKENNKVSTSKLVIGVELNGVAKAYPVQIVGYHHKVRDTIAGKPLIITYCTACRSGRVYSAEVDGQPDHFKLVGMNKNNSVFEDKTTGSWWQQETGVAIAGPMKDSSLHEIPSRQVTLSSWLKDHPKTKVMQADPNYLSMYGLEFNDRAYFYAASLQRDTVHEKNVLLVIGIQHKEHVKTIEWNKLNYQRLIEDSMPALPLLFTLENDNASFHAWNRNVNGETFQFERTKNAEEIKDVNTQSVWNMKGECIEGKLQGTQLEEVQSYLETERSWNEFHEQETETE